MPSSRFLSVFVMLVAFATREILAAEHVLRIEVLAGDSPRRNTPVAVDVMLPANVASARNVTIAIDGGGPIAGQLTPLPPPSVAAAPTASTDEAKLDEAPPDDDANPEDPETASDAEPARTDAARPVALLPARLHFILPSLDAATTATCTVRISDEPRDAGADGSTEFHWVDTSRERGPDDACAEASRELRFGDRPVVRFMHTPLDERSAESRAATYKPYHHVYDPAGKRYVTKGPGGIFPHHRGLFFGFSRITYGDGQQADVWHNGKGESQRCETIVSEEAGPVLGRHAARIAWHGRDGHAFAEETRSLTAYAVAGGTLLEWSTTLRSLGGTVKLDGDPQHAGFHFRAAQDVPDGTAKQTSYVRPDGRAAPGAFRNWPAQREHVNLDWLALSFVIDGSRFTCCYLDRPSNPKEARFSERDYGRFGSYFEYELTPDRPLELAYRIWLADGEMDVPGIAALHRDFVSPPAVKVLP